MTTKYLLPCSCGKNTPIETSQAGETFSCVCGEKLTAPTLRGIRLLPVAQDTSASGKSSRGWGAAPVRGESTWGAKHGVLLLGGLLLVAGLLTQTYLLATAQGIDPDQIQRDASIFTPAEAWGAWIGMERGLPGSLSPRTQSILRDAWPRTKMMITGGVALIAGAALLGLGAYKHLQQHAVGKPA
jgi:hypothetical protein